MTELHEKSETLKAKLKSASDSWKSNPSDTKKGVEFYNVVKEIKSFTAHNDFWAVSEDVQTEEQILSLYKERLSISIDLGDYLKGFTLFP